MPRKPADHPVHQYARAVVSGEILAGELVRLACQRHLDDLLRDDVYYDAVAANVAIEFFGLLKHSKGRWAGAVFDLQLWQVFFIGCISGWKRTATKKRRFRFAHLEVARKNGKTTLASGIGLLLFLLDGEAGAEVYNVATKLDQAKLCHEESKRMIAASPAIKKRCVVYKNNINCPSTASKYEPLGRDSETLDGLNVSGAVCDELHAWKDRSLWDVIETACGAREQPLIISTTTAGFNRQSIWWERREHLVQVLRGVRQDDAVFGLIYTLDEDDDWTDETTWGKANPNLSVTVKLEDLRAECEQAKAIPGKQNSFKRLKLDLPTDQAELWLDLAKWDKCKGVVDEELLRGRPCFGGMDLSATNDTTALAWLFLPTDDDPLYRLLVRFWLPGDDLYEREKRDGQPYRQWAEEGHLKLTDGEFIDYASVELQILGDPANGVEGDAEKFDVKALLFDRWMANQLTSKLLDEGIDVQGFGQGFASMAAPVKEFEKLVGAARLIHNGNPLLRAQIGSAAVKQDEAGNRKPSKKHSTARIDGPVASVMALGGAIGQPVEPGKPTVEIWG